MAPPNGPPPYTTIEQLSALTTDEQKRRAKAELSSWIAGAKIHKEEQRAAELNDSTRGFTGPQRTNHYRGRGRGRGSGYYRGRGYGAYSYSPYPHPQAAARTYRNNSVAFNNTGQPLESQPAADAPLSEDSGAHVNTPTPRNVPQANITSLCPTFTSSGICARGESCPHVHDPTKLALCKGWLYKDNCTRGNRCRLSHEPSPENTPTCLHFQEGGCNKDNCHFAHVHVNPGTLVCQAFGRLGYCEKGHQCANLHVYECPDFSNKGSCPDGDTCRLRHVHDASRMRAAAHRSSDTASPLPLHDDNEGAVGHVEELQNQNETIDDVGDIGKTLGNSHVLSQQADFVPFDFDD